MELYEMHRSLGSYLDDVDTLESSDPARGLLISIVSQTELSIAIVAPTIDLQTRGKFRLRIGEGWLSVCLEIILFSSLNKQKTNLTYPQLICIFSQFLSSLSLSVGAKLVTGKGRRYGRKTFI